MFHNLSAFFGVCIKFQHKIIHLKNRIFIEFPENFAVKFFAVIII